MDHNISHRICSRFQNLQLISVASLQMDQSDDVLIWEYAARHGYHLMSKDGDMVHLVSYYGQPLKLIWLDIGNTTFKQLEQCIQNHANQIQEFLKNQNNILRVRL